MELKFAFRSLRSRPGFTILAIAILALGIGANTAIFSVVNSVLLRPLDYRDPDRIVAVGNTWRIGRKTAMNQVAEADFDDLHDATTVFEGLTGYMGGSGVSSVTAGNSAEFAGTSRVTEDFFRVMGIEPNLGRLFSHDEQQPGAPMLAVIGDS